MRTLVVATLLAGYATVFVVAQMSARLFRQAFDPLDPMPHRVETLIVAARFDQARRLAMTLRDRHPREPQVAYWLGRIYRGLHDSASEAAAWEDYVASSPAPEDACPAWPEAYEALGQIPRAVATYERCVRLDPDNADRLMDLGDAYARIGRPADALPAFERAKGLDPDNPWLASRIAAARKPTP